MAEGKQNKAATNMKRQGQGQQQDRSTQKSTDKKELSEVPVLKYGQSTNNFIKFKEALSTAALIEFGNVGKLIQLGVYYEIAIPDEADYVVRESLPWSSSGDHGSLFFGALQHCFLPLSRVIVISLSRVEIMWDMSALGVFIEKTYIHKSKVCS
jgi:hypothetical protein